MAPPSDSARKGTAPAATGGEAASKMKHSENPIAEAFGRQRQIPAEVQKMAEALTGDWLAQVPSPNASMRTSCSTSSGTAFLSLTRTSSGSAGPTSGGSARLPTGRWTTPKRTPGHAAARKGHHRALKHLRAKRQ